MNLKNLFFRLTHWETWHYMAKYIPIMPVWGWYCLRARSLWFFTSSNPTISFGGFEGETKREMYEQLPPGSYPKSIYITPAFSFEETERLMQESGFEYPFAVKPDAGMMGFMFRRINNAEELQAYHQKMAVDYIIQSLVQYSVYFITVFQTKKKERSLGF